tara:strand:+ start:110455 stop:110838 length:384 start_codon:yes stop_codon:yes gene_type:complete
MGQKNDRRVSRDPTALPDFSREEHVKSSLDALFEEELAIGFTEVEYTTNGNDVVSGGVFPKTITVYTDDQKTETRAKCLVTYGEFPFVTNIVKQFFRGNALYFYTTTNISRNSNKTVNTVETIATKI